MNAGHFDALVRFFKAQRGEQRAQEDMKPSLDSLGLKYQTDKASSFHNYLVHYDELLESMRQEHIDILEIGVYAGSSIRMWHEYFPAARIVGVDVNPINIT